MTLFADVQYILLIAQLSILLLPLPILFVCALQFFLYFFFSTLNSLLDNHLLFYTCSLNC